MKSELSLCRLSSLRSIIDRLVVANRVILTVKPDASAPCPFPVDPVNARDPTCVPYVAGPISPVLLVRNAP